MANGHGGARPGAGRPRKSLAQKILDGTEKKHKSKVLNIPKPGEPVLPEPPDFLRTIVSYGVGNEIPGMKDIFEQTSKWLETTNCLHLINPQLITEYAILTTRWLECEYIVAKGLVLKHPKSELIPNAMADQGLRYWKAADTAWGKIWNIVAQNSTAYFGDDPNQDIMAFLIRNKPTP
jgi:hypothetical protein